MKVNQQDFALLAERWWVLRTECPFDSVRMPGFFDPVIHSGIRPHDRIDVIALGDDPATHAALVIDDIQINTPRVNTSVLVEYKRGAV